MKVKNWHFEIKYGKSNKKTNTFPTLIKNQQLMKITSTTSIYISLEIRDLHVKYSRT